MGKCLAGWLLSYGQRRGKLCPCMSDVDRAEGQRVAFMLYLPCCNFLPTTSSPQPCPCISKNMPLSACAVNSLIYVLYINQLLCRTNRNLACPWGQLVFQMVCVVRSISHSTFSAQCFEFVLSLSTEGSGHPSASVRDTTPHLQRMRFCPYLLWKFVKLCPDFCNACSSSPTWHFWRKREGGFLRPLVYLSWWWVS